MVSKLFSKDKVKVVYERARPRFDDYSFLHQYAFNDLLDRFKDINRSFNEAIFMTTELDQGEVVMNELQHLNKLDQVKLYNTGSASDFDADFETLGLGKDSVDCVLGHFIHHKVNDLPGNLIQIRQALRPDGLFIAAMLGGETLYELRQSLAMVETSIFNCQATRIHPFADKQQMGELMMRAGFALPVVDSDVIKVSYKDVYALMHDIKGMGEGYALSQSAYPATKGFFDKVDAYYKDQFKDPQDQTRIEASFEIIYLLGWAPHSSQQQPAKRGSGQVSLTEVLDTEGQDGES